VLEERLNDKKEQLLEKDLVLEEVTALYFVKKINRTQTHTHTDREQHPRHRHTHSMSKNQKM